MPTKLPALLFQPRSILRSCLLSVVALVVVTSAVIAEDVDIRHHREVYAEINAHANTWRKATATYKNQDVVFELQGWFDGTTLRKIKEEVPGEDGGGYEELYLEKGLPLFVFRTYKEGKKTVEDRFYFREGKLVQWLETSRKSVAPDSEDFKAEAERLTSNCRHFIAAFKK